MRTSEGIATVAIVSALVACAPTIEPPNERQRRVDTEDARALEAQLAVLPGAARAQVMLRRRSSDPLRSEVSSSPAASAVVIVDDRADRARVHDAAAALLRAAAPEVSSPTVIIEVGARRPQLATVGPFEVVASSKRGVQVSFAIVLGMLAAACGWIVVRERTRSRAL